MTHMEVGVSPGILPSEITKRSNIYDLNQTNLFNKQH